MNSTFVPSEWEKKLYEFWEKKQFFKAHIDHDKKPFTIILPPPNANADLHLGHAMYVYEDIMIRYQKLRGFETLWLPGADHAGIETQFVFEKQLAKQDKSRFDYDRETLFDMIWEFVQKNRENMEDQLRRLGFALDWSRKTFTMDKDVVDVVYKTFKKLHEEGLIYRAFRLVNYCTHCGTSFSDLEVKDKEMTAEQAKAGIYEIEYKLKDGGSLIVATTRPETMFGDTAIMVNPHDSRYKSFIGKVAIVPIVKREIPIIADEYVDIKFGTGAVKVTPAHDFNDFEIGQKHNLPIIQVIGFDGKIYGTNTQYDEMRLVSTRLKLIEELNLKPKQHKVVLKSCYRCGRTLEPLPKEQWFIKVRPLADQAKKLVKEGKITVYPKRFTKHLTTILDNFIDWNISRQIVWGIRIPAFYHKTKKEWIVENDPEKQKALLQDPQIEQDPDTFDTWFSSAQWPFATLQIRGDEEFDYFYPTAVMETGYDILRAWVSRMIMIGQFATGKEPFKTVFLHGMVRDRQGQKMSKSRGNVINPLQMVDTYGADALRASLIFGTKEGGDMSLSEDKIRGMRNFANKIWNIGRFILINKNTKSETLNSKQTQNEPEILKELQKEFSKLKKQVIKDMDSYKFSKALDNIYEFIWHRFADYYIEQLKGEVQSGNIRVLETLEAVYRETLILAHPFIPFVTEAVWQEFDGSTASIIDGKIKI